MGVSEAAALLGVSVRSAQRLGADGALTFLARVTDHDLTTIRALAETSTALLALDAASSLDPRERGVELRLLDEHLERFRG